MRLHWVLAWTVAAASADREAAFQQALALEKQGDAPAALAAMDQIVTQHPAWELPRLEASRLRLERGQGLERVELDLEAARSIAPENPRAHYLWALWLDEQRRPGQAMEALEIALTLRPQYEDALFRMGGLALAHDKPKRAVEAYRGYLARKPEATGARLSLAQALERSGDVAGAERELQGLAKAPATKGLGTQKLADLYLRTGQAHKAAKLKTGQEPPPKRKLRPLLPSRR